MLNKNSALFWCVKIGKIFAKGTFYNSEALIIYLGNTTCLFWGNFDGRERYSIGSWYLPVWGKEMGTLPTVLVDIKVSGGFDFWEMKI